MIKDNMKYFAIMMLLLSIMCAFHHPIMMWLVPMIGYLTYIELEGGNE